MAEGELEQMNGYIRKYLAEINQEKDQYLCDDGILADPDFFVNRSEDGKITPTWMVCGPYLRRRLKEKDVLFFLPAKRRLQKIGLAHYICTGILTVKKVIANKNEALKCTELNDDFKRRYSIDLKSHITKDKRTTATLRPKNIILGDPRESFWFGRNGYSLRQVLLGLGLSSLGNHLNYRELKLEESEALKLKNYLKSHLKAVKDESHGYVHLERPLSNIGCLSCSSN